MRLFILTLVMGVCIWTRAQEQPKKTEPQWQGKFEQLDGILPTPNVYRSGSGAPGPNYWQQRADYVIHIELDDENQRIIGSETITYTNNSPDDLPFLWLQLDQNRLEINGFPDRSNANGPIPDTIYTKQLAGELSAVYGFDGGHKIKSVKETNGTLLPYTINSTMMRVNLPTPLKSGKQFSFNVEWSYNMPDRMKHWTRGDYEYFPEGDNYIYAINRFYPRMCVYDDYEGWQNKQFLGQGEFALPFGNYKVDITVPADHIVGATGSLQNAKETLTREQLSRFETAKKSFDKPVIIATQDEAIAREKTKVKEKKKWIFYAENVRDFALTSSRKFIWDAQAVKIGDKTPLAMSFYPKEGNPLWERESTKAVKNTLATYSKYTIDYPYPVAISVHTASIGMEYPMICFNYGRPNKDGSYSNNLKWGMIGVIIHEVGHNFFPMIINSDERQMTWMDEGVNTFVEYRTMVERYPDMPTPRGPAKNIVPYMKAEKSIMRPLMTNSEQVLLFGWEQYGKAATALNILRETVVGPELFDFAFKTYAQQWAFKHPKPADFFRTIENASAVDLDWFWRGWFYGTDHCDIAVEKVRWLKPRVGSESFDNKMSSTQQHTPASGAQEAHNDFSAGPQPLDMVNTPVTAYGEFTNRIDEKAIMGKLTSKNLYEVTLQNKGGLVMPVIIEWTYTDGSKEVDRLPAEIWRTNESEVTKVFMKDKEVASILLDPMKETSDVDESNNVFPKREQASPLDQFKQKK